MEYQGDRGFQGFQGFQGASGAGSEGPQGFQGFQGTPAPALGIDSVQFFSLTPPIQPITTANAFQDIALTMGPIGSPGTTWIAQPGNTGFTSSVTGFYQISYKADVATGDAGGAHFFATSLTLDGNEILGSGSMAQAPSGNNHTYLLSNTIIFSYNAGQVLAFRIISEETEELFYRIPSLDLDHSDHVVPSNNIHDDEH